jgi:hypothetical protein
MSTPTTNGQHAQRLGVGAATAVLITVGALGAPAQARPVDRGTIDEQFSEVIRNFCGQRGLTVYHDVVVSGRFQFNVRTPGTAPYYLERLKFDETFRNKAGERVTASTGVLDKDLKITDNGNGTLTILTLATGPATLYNAAGKAIARDPGQIRLKLLIDHNGTLSDPSDDHQIGDAELVKGSTGRSDDFCAAIVEELG